MSLIGKNTLSLRKKDVKESKSIGVGFKKIQFAHKATLGDSGISLTSLIAPTEMTGLGFTNPGTAELVGANLLFFRKNLTLISSVKGVLVDQLSYTVASSTRISFNGWTAEDGEIFIGTIDTSAKTELRAVDATPIVATGLLTVGNTDFNVGTPFEVNKYPLTQQGAVLVFRNGVQQFRNTGNTSTPDGNYYELQAGAGLGTVIRFNNAAAGVDDNILVVSNGLLAERPDGSMMAVIESLAGQLDQVIPTVAALAGVPETDFQAAPNNVDLKQFGDWVLGLLDAQVPITTEWTAFTPTGAWTTNTTYTGFWRRVGDSIELDIRIATSGAPNAAVLSINIPFSLVIDTSKMTSAVAALYMFQSDGIVQDNASRQQSVKAVYNNTTSFFLVFDDGAGSTTGLTQAVPITFGAGDAVQILVKMPIAGWTATQSLREQLGF